MRGDRDGVPRTAGELRRLRLLDLLEDAQLEQILTVARFEVLRARSNRTYAELVGDEACFVWKGQIRVANAPDILSRYRAAGLSAAPHYDRVNLAASMLAVLEEVAQPKQEPRGIAATQK